MPVELVYRMVIVVAIRCFLDMGVADSRSLRFDTNVRTYDTYEISCSSIYLLYPLSFDGVSGMCGDNSGNVFLLLFMVLWVPIYAMLGRRAMPILWHAFEPLGMPWPKGFFPLSSLNYLIGAALSMVSTAFSCIIICTRTLNDES
jgi:hypothetical protein